MHVIANTKHNMRMICRVSLDVISSLKPPCKIKGVKKKRPNKERIKRAIKLLTSGERVFKKAIDILKLRAQRSIKPAPIKLGERVSISSLF